VTSNQDNTGKKETAGPWKPGGGRPASTSPQLDGHQPPACTGCGAQGADGEGRDRLCGNCAGRDYAVSRVLDQAEELRRQLEQLRKRTLELAREARRAGMPAWFPGQLDAYTAAALDQLASPQAWHGASGNLHHLITEFRDGDREEPEL
jgi:hypothetical protein